MKQKMYLWTLMLLIVGNVGCWAQEMVSETVQRLIRQYPDATHRVEYRLAPIGEGKMLREYRYDFRIRRNELQEVDEKALKEVCRKAWEAACPQTDRMMKYEHGDSLCSTIVYRVRKGAGQNLMKHDIPQRFWGNDGYLLFDVGEYVSVIVDQTMMVEGQPEKVDFSNISTLFNGFCQEGRECREVPVRYTGNKGAFVFQRGQGSGWTKGVRKTLSGASSLEMERLKQAFWAYVNSRKAVNVIVYNHEFMIKDEWGDELLMASWDIKKKLHFLSATVEKEVCVPAEWTVIDFFNNGQVQWVDVSRLDSLYDHLSAHVGGTSTTVQYTGSFVTGFPGFAWQRGWGNGWTRGKRLTIDGLTSNEVMRIRDVFCSYQGLLGHVNLRDQSVVTYEEGTRTFYGFEVHPDGKAFFLKATTENEICIPIDWTTRDYFEGSRPSSIEQASDATKRLLGLSRLWAGVRQNFVFMDRIKVDWDSLYVAMIPQMAAVHSHYEAVRLLQQMAAQVHDGHTFVWDHSGCVSVAPLLTKRLGGRVYVDAVRDSLLWQEGIRRGQELIAIDGMPLEQYAKQNVVPYAASSTSQWLDHICYEGFGLMERKKGDRLRLTLREGHRQFDVFYTMGTALWNIPDIRRPFEFSVLCGNVGYLRISSFNDNDIRQWFDDHYADILRTRALVIDLRGNEGGNSEHSDYILRHLTADSLQTSSWRSPMYIPAFASWGRKSEWYNSPSEKMAPMTGKEIYKCPIVLLVDCGTFSAAEDFCSVFRGMKRGLLVGQPTGGSTGNGVRIELIPGVASANICAKHDTAVDGTEFVGVGFVPDILVEETYESYFINPQDRAVSTALQLLEEK